MKIKAKAKTLRQRHMHRNSRSPTARIPAIPHPPDLFRPATQAQHRNRCNLTRGLKPIAARHLEISTVESETGHGRRGMHDTDSIIDVELPSGYLVQPDRDGDVKILLAHFRRCHPRGGALRVDDAAAVVQRDISDGEVREGHVRAAAMEGRKGPEVVADVVGHIHIDAGSVLFRDRGDEDAGAVEVLQVRAEAVGIVLVDVERGVHEGSPVDGVLVEGGVDVVEKLVAHVNDFARSGCYRGPAVEFLPDSWWVGVVVPLEGTEGP
jgi:hypothetical protein